MYYKDLSDCVAGKNRGEISKMNAWHCPNLLFHANGISGSRGQYVLAFTLEDTQRATVWDLC